MLGVLRAICTVVGAVVLYCAVIAALWYALIRAGRRRGHRHADRRAAARCRMPSRLPSAAVPVRPAAEPAGSWDDLPSWLWPDRPWAVAVVLLGAPAVRDRTAPFVDFTTRSVDWPALLEQARSLAAATSAHSCRARTSCPRIRRIRRGRLEPRMG